MPLLVAPSKPSTRTPPPRSLWLTSQPRSRPAMWTAASPATRSPLFPTEPFALAPAWPHPRPGMPATTTSLMPASCCSGRQRKTKTAALKPSRCGPETTAEPFQAPPPRWRSQSMPSTMRRSSVVINQP